MEESSFIVETLAGVLLFAVGVRLLRLTSRTHGRHERLLWIFQIGSSLVIVPMYAGYEANQYFTFGTDVALGIFEILAASMTWLAFFAPSFYCNWIAKGTSSANAEKGS